MRRLSSTQLSTLKNGPMTQGFLNISSAHFKTSLFSRSEQLCLKQCNLNVHTNDTHPTIIQSLQLNDTENCFQYTIICMIKEQELNYDYIIHYKNKHCCYCNLINAWVIMILMYGFTPSYFHLPLLTPNDPLK